MFRKLIYFLMMMLGVFSAIALLSFPMYKFDGDKILTSYSEYFQVIELKDGSEPYSDVELVTSNHEAFDDAISSADDDEAKLMKEEYKKVMESYYAIMTSDKEKYYSIQDYEIYNSIKEELYEELCTIESPNHSCVSVKLSLESLEDLKSTDDYTAFIAVLNNAIGVLKDADKIGEEITIDNYVDDITDQVMKDKYDMIIDYLGGSEKAAETVKFIAVEDVMKNLFIQYDDITSSELYDATTEDFVESGFKFNNIIKAWSNLFERYEILWSQAESDGQNFFGKLKAIFSYSYKPWALIVVSFTIILILLNSLHLFFAGLKGMNGRKRPKVFGYSFIISCIGIFLIMGISIISIDSVFSFHQLQWSRLVELFTYGHMASGIIIPSIAAIASIVITFMGIFCKFGSKKEKI